MPLMRLLLIASLGACAQAGKADVVGKNPDGGGIFVMDSTTRPPPDAFVNPIDAPPGVMTKTLDENTSDTIKLANTVACVNSSQETAAAQYWRVFNPANFQITTDFKVTQVSFQVESSQSGDGNGQTVTVKVGIYDAAVPTTSFDTSKLMGLAQDANVQVAEANEVGQTINVPIAATIPAGKNVFVEVDTLDGVANVLQFFMGSNDQPESNPGWIKSSCLGTNPVNASAPLNTQTSLLMTVTGQY